jgi:3-oxoacyl-[acyl-carrier-protein] synthase III
MISFIMSTTVYINSLSRFLPGEPVSNDEMEDYLGFVGGDIRSKSKSIILRNNKITNRYYAIKKDGTSTHTNFELAAQAVRNLESENFKLTDLQLLTAGTTTPDQILPSHASMVHGSLKIKPVESISFSGSCCSAVNALKYAWMSVQTGNSTNAVAVGSEKLSHWMQARNFKEEAEKLKQLEANPILGFEKDFLRWMLSDGAAAALLTNAPNKNGISLQIDYIDIVSFANEVDACMYAGGEKNPDGGLNGWLTFDQSEWLDKSLFSLKQDTRLLDQHIIRLGTQTIADTFKKHQVNPAEIDWFLPHISSEYFRSKLDDEMQKEGIGIDKNKWFLNLTKVGNVGAASILLALEELFNSGNLIKGQKIALIIPESARFSFANVMLTVC